VRLETTYRNRRLFVLTNGIEEVLEMIAVDASVEDVWIATSSNTMAKDKSLLIASRWGDFIVISRQNLVGR
jgi:hypothetical protein